MKNKTFIESIRCAFKGLMSAFKQEKNFKIYFLHLIITLVLNVCLGFNIFEFIIWGITVVGVFSSECINTAIEMICDFLTKEKNETIGIIKDIAAGAVCCWGAIFYVAEITMIVMRFI